MHTGWHLVVVPIAFLIAGASFASASPRKVHIVSLAAAKKEPYSKAGDPAGAQSGENSLKVRALVVDGLVKDWTTGEAHDITARSFVVRRALRLNDALPGDKAEHWVWQRGPWILVDRTSGHITPLHLPDYDPGVSQLAWFRDYAAYCGLTTSGKSLYAVVAQVAARKPVLSKRIEAFDPDKPVIPACAPPEWQRDPLRITFHPTGKDAVSYNIVPGSAVLVEDSGDDSDAAPAADGKAQ